MQDIIFKWLIARKSLQKAVKMLREQHDRYELRADNNRDLLPGKNRGIFASFQCSSYAELDPVNP